MTCTDFAVYPSPNPLPNALERGSAAMFALAIWRRISLLLGQTVELSRSTIGR